MSDTEQPVDSQEDFLKSSSFDALPLKKWLKDQCRLLGFEHPTPVQYTCIPRVLEGECAQNLITHLPVGIF